jgi:uncharacterized membrane protein YfcA
MTNALDCPYFRRAFGWCVPIGGLVGLIGLGGGEFRLPILMCGIGFEAPFAVPLNLLTNLITLAFSLAIRSSAISLAPVAPRTAAVVRLLAGGILSDFYGTRLVSRLSNRRLVGLIALLLGGLMTEAFLPFQSDDLLPPLLRISRRDLESVSASDLSAVFSAWPAASC